MCDIPHPSGPFRIGDRVQLTGPKGRLHTITLREAGELHTHNGVIPHASLVGQPDGSVVINSAGHEYLALRPLLRDFVMSMRSEEHTSELHSLMRISYAVFCLKKKIPKNTQLRAHNTRYEQ